MYVFRTFSFSFFSFLVIFVSVSGAPRQAVGPAIGPQRALCPLRHGRCRFGDGAGLAAFAPSPAAPTPPRDLYKPDLTPSNDDALPLPLFLARPLSCFPCPDALPPSHCRDDAVLSGRRPLFHPALAESPNARLMGLDGLRRLLVPGPPVPPLVMLPRLLWEQGSWSFCSHVTMVFILLPNRQL